MVGFFYKYGMGDLEINKKTALKYYKKAADLENAYGMAEIGRFYENGEADLEKDLTKALKWYQKAADLGNIDAKNRLEELSRK